MYRYHKNKTRNEWHVKICIPNSHKVDIVQPKIKINQKNHQLAMIFLKITNGDYESYVENPDLLDWEEG